MLLQTFPKVDNDVIETASIRRARGGANPCPMQTSGPAASGLCWGAPYGESRLRRDEVQPVRGGQIKRIADERGGE